MTKSTEPRAADLSAMGNEELVTRYAKHVRRLAYLEAEGGLRSAFGFTPQHDTMAEISELCNDAEEFGSELLRRLATTAPPEPGRVVMGERLRYIIAHRLDIEYDDGELASDVVAYRIMQDIIAAERAASGGA